MNKTFYQKYRPAKFDEIFGQKHVVQTLKNEVINNRIVNSYIFSGQKGSGKTSIAKIFAKAVNCLSLDNGNPCNQCKNCLLINNNATLDFLEIDAASNNGVDHIRNIITSTKYQPQDLKYKVYIVDEAHMLTISAWNALLKTIEEPLSQIIFIFATTEFNKIPETIISRSQRFDFFKISNVELTNLILNVVKNENIKIDDGSINAIINLSQGSARDCLSMLDQINSLANNDINVRTVNDVFGLIDIDSELTFINNIINNQFDLVIKQINIFEQNGINFYHLYVAILNDLLDAYIYKLTQNDFLLNKLSKYDVQKINDIDYLFFINYLTDNIIKIKSSDCAKIIFEFLVLNLMDKNNHYANLLNNYSPNNETSNNENKNQKAQNINTCLKQANENVIEAKQDQEKLPLISEVFNTSYSVFDNGAKNNDEVNNNINGNENNSNINYIDKYRDDVFKIAFNRNKEICENLNQKLTSFLEQKETFFDPNINSFLNIKKFVISSSNGSLIQMDNEFVAERFNAISNSNNFMNFFQDKFGMKQHIIALDKSAIKQLMDEYKSNKPKHLDDVNLDNKVQEKDNLINKIIDIGNKINKKN